MDVSKYLFLMHDCKYSKQGNDLVVSLFALDYFQCKLRKRCDKVGRMERSLDISMTNLSR